MPTMEPLARFAQKWCLKDDGPTPIDGAALRAAEVELGVAFPDDYRGQVLAIGCPSPTMALETAISDFDLDLWPRADLHEPAEIIEATRGLRAAGMPVLLVVIGSDHSGNLFCFREDDLRRPTATKVPVHLWDHDLGTTDRLADSFSAWIESYLGEWSDSRSATDF